LEGFVTRLQAINVTFKGAHQILPKVDALSRPFGVVARSPLFDRSIVELSFAIPPQLKLRGSVEKYLLKQAVQDLLPSGDPRPAQERHVGAGRGLVSGSAARPGARTALRRPGPRGLFRRDYWNVCSRAGSVACGRGTGRRSGSW
jgi:asparagine synthase (glutamine-hydrolysing)